MCAAGTAHAPRRQELLRAGYRLVVPVLWKVRREATLAQERLHLGKERDLVVRLEALLLGHRARSLVLVVKSIVDGQVRPVMRSKTSMYRCLVASTTSGGMGGPGGVRSQSDSAADQSRRYCLSSAC